MRCFILSFVLLLNAIDVSCFAQSGCWEITPLNSGCPPLDLQLVDCSGAVSSEWNVNGQIFNGDTVIYYVSDTGYYTISLTSTFGNGSDTMMSIDKLIGPIGDFVFTPTVLCQGSEALLTLSGVNLTAFNLTAFDDQGDVVWIGNALNWQFMMPPYYIPFFDSGCYTFEYVIMDIVGCKDTIVKEDYVCVNALIADFAVLGNDSISCPPLVASFENTSSCFDSLSCDCVWDFGDGSPLVTGCNPTHTYIESGFFDVALIVTCGGVSDTIVKEDYIEVGGPFADITTIIDDPCGPVTVCYALDSTNAVSFLFCPGNNMTCISGPFDTLCIAYDSIGIYEPSILICDDIGCCFEKFLDPVYVDSVHASFGVSQNVVCGSDAVQFYDSSFSAIGTIASHHWNFGDGTTSTLANPTHSYADTGCYDVTLIVTGLGGCSDTATLDDFICVVPGVDAGFGIVSMDPSCNPPVTVCLLNISTPVFSNINWIFEGGVPNTSTVEQPCVLYNAAGSFDVTLIASNTNGCSDTALLDDFIEIGDFYTTVFTADTLVQWSDTVFFSATPQGAVNSWFVIPSSGVVQVAVTTAIGALQFTQTGNYSVCLATVFPGGCSAQDCITITVNDTLDSTNPLFNSESFVHLQPNPASHQVVLSVQSAILDNGAVNIFSVDGKLLSSREQFFHQGVNEMKLDVSDLQNGIYMLQVKSTSFTANRKLVIQR